MIESQPIPMIAVKQELDKSPIFGVLKQQEQFLLAEACRQVKFRRGQTLIKEGEQTSFLYIITQGNVEIKSYGKLVAKVGEKSLLGEVAAADMGLATATVVACNDVVTICLPIKEVQILADSYADFKDALYDAALSRLLG
jgi:signal-transduction protein with cAMP-binding, CBS, and nucleotidyltransferase domain